MEVREVARVPDFAEPRSAQIPVRADLASGGTQVIERRDSRPTLESRRVSPPEASWRAMTDPIPPVPMTAVVMTGTSSASQR